MTIKDNGLSHLLTAEKANELALYAMWHYQPSDSRPVACAVPDPDTAKAYIAGRNLNECYFDGVPYLPYCLDGKSPIGIKFNSDADIMIHLDLRDQVFTDDNGKKGLKDVFGYVVVEPSFDGFPELYPFFKRERLGQIPVVIGDRQYLYDLEERRITTKGYDRIFRYFWNYGGHYVDDEERFVFVESGRKGIIDGYDCKESSIALMDEIYAKQNRFSAIPFVKDGKIGFLWGAIWSAPAFDKVVLGTDVYTRALMDGKWGWIDRDGMFTQEKSEAAFGCWDMVF